MYEILEGLLQVISCKSFTVYSGIKSTGQIVKEEARRGQFSPDKTDINFAVPTPKSVAKFESVDIDIPNEIAPGLKAWQSIGCQKIKLMCWVSMEKTRPCFKPKK